MNQPPPEWHGSTSRTGGFVRNSSEPNDAEIRLGE